MRPFYIKNTQGESSRIIQLIAGRTAQEYNFRKNRNGAFWGDRDHTTAVDTNTHQLRCIVGCGQSARISAIFTANFRQLS